MCCLHEDSLKRLMKRERIFVEVTYINSPVFISILLCCCRSVHVWNERMMPWNQTRHRASCLLCMLVPLATCEIAFPQLHNGRDCTAVTTTMQRLLYSNGLWVQTVKDGAVKPLVKLWVLRAHCANVVLTPMCQDTLYDKLGGVRMVQIH